MPLILKEKEILKQIEWAKVWLRKEVEKNPSLLQRFEQRDYTSGQSLTINERTFIIQIIRDQRISVRSHIKGHTIYIYVPNEENGEKLNKAIQQILSRSLAKYFYNEVYKRIHALNDLYIHESFNAIRIKYNKSNWGSCSSKRNINISSRLLFAPKEVQDYVFIHELTHLKELNHSPRFWSIVKSIVPDYKEKENWLKKNSHQCDF